MSSRWVSVIGDDLSLIHKAVEFLQREFCAADADPVWSVEYFQWKIGQTNPAGAGYVSLALLDDEVVGIVSLTRKRLLINGRHVDGGEVGDTYTSARVRKGYRPAALSLLDSDPSSYINRSIFGRLASEIRARAQSDGVKVIYGTPNANAHPGWTKRLGYFDFKGYDNQSYSRPTWRMIIKKYPKLTFAKSLIRALDIAYISIHAKFCRLQNNQFEFVRNSSNIYEIEDLWRRIKPTIGFSLMRDGAYWRHRYLEHPIAKYDIFGVRRNNMLVAVAAVRILTVAGGKRVLLIAEWMCEKDVPFKFLLTNILDTCKNLQIDILSLYANASHKEAKESRQSLFMKMGQVPIILADTKEGIEVGAIKDHVYFFRGSTDNA